MSRSDIPFHAGELAAQHRAGAGHIAEQAAPFIRDFMPDQHRDFYQAQPFLVAASGDAEGRVWATIIEGPDGFVEASDPRTLELNTHLDPSDPLAQALGNGADIGVVGIELATRRRNRLSGRTRPIENGLAIDIRQTFGNCPQYINERDWWRVARNKDAKPVVSDHLSPAQIAHITRADTLFIGSGRHGPQGLASDGFDASHRGGEPGFVRVIGPNQLRIPDYSGNNFFNTIGNLLEDPRIGLLFVDFASGGLLHLTGRAEIDWTPAEAQDPNILRMIDVQVDAVVERPEALSLRWSAQPASSTKLMVADKVKEAENITSFHFVPANGHALASFQAGQHLPIALDIPHLKTKVRRTYSLSGNPGNEHFRITVKREPQGAASTFLHDKIEVGDVIEARPPAGDFVIPEGNNPLVLVSAGVGLTPMVAMLYQSVQQNGDRPVWFVHGARNGHHHALRDEVDQLIAANRNTGKRVYYSAPVSTDQLGRDFDVQGRITANELLALCAGDDAQYLLCGPAGFVTGLQTGLEAAGVPKSQIHFETFGS
ncbi:pyridoxamine 5'-phosphate oxidase family protein [Ruegeria sp. R14_0]|uniref:FAD-binding oxidoreductase n=1 Tax=Ruegeria sp. R14_0 TaxID=2821100 RepID=UPI001ADB09EA|nr:pyridoxamine 5'-phosphate oxidase family protein [Ruegeria sp. R14_0]MBO9447555.1 pyridoxamine 5'-phosphate oxidase family protein [Ruegeria sp. R14_0]